MAMENIVHSNLLPYIVKHYMHIYELNGTLMKLANFIKVNYRVQHFLFSPLAMPCNSKRNDKTHKHKTTPKVNIALASKTNGSTQERSFRDT